MGYNVGVGWGRKEKMRRDMGRRMREGGVEKRREGRKLWLFYLIVMGEN